MTVFQAVVPAEAHPVREEYVVERALSDGGWVNESIFPESTPEAAEEQRARLLEGGTYRAVTFRIVRRTITSTVIAVRPPHQEGPS